MHLQPCHIHVHYSFEPKSHWWTKLKNTIPLQKHVLEPIYEIFGNPLHHPAHKSDVVRICTWMGTGGGIIKLDDSFLEIL
jgi:hypothetical protein